MAEFNYTINDLESSNALYQALLQNGVFDAAFTISGNGIIVATIIGNQAQCDAAVQDARSASLFARKVAKIDQANARSIALSDSGVEDWAGRKVPLSKNDADNYFTDFEYYSANPGKLSANSPYIVFTLDGRASSTTNAADIQTLSENAVDRLIYIYTSSSNGDGSKGELALVQEILAAPDLLALNAITDTRV